MARKRKRPSDKRKLVHNDRKLESKINRAIKDRDFPERTGLFLTVDSESLPIFGPEGDVERVIARKKTDKGKSGARIVLTKDNFGSRATGYGGAGGTMCEAIDLVAGALSCEKHYKTADTETRANFFTDASRIYLTERGDIQYYFGVAPGSPACSISSKNKAGIGIKSDHTLVIGRERVRILVGLGNAIGGERLVNQNDNVTPKIEIGRVNATDSQPAVLGNNLVSYLREQSDLIEDLRQKILNVENELFQYKTAMALHSHQGVGLGAVVVFPSPGAAFQPVMGIARFLNTTIENIIDTYNSKITEWKYLGLENGVLKGAMEERILSSTVYIGK